MDAIDEFVQWRFLGGYEWSAGTEILPEGASGATLISDKILAPNPGAESDEFEQCQVPADLFLEFIATPPSPEEIKAFANRHGLLGLESPQTGAALIVNEFPDSDQPHGTSPHGKILGDAISGERLSAWGVEISEMATAWTLWTEIQKAEEGDLQPLARHIRWKSDKLVYLDSLPHMPLSPGEISEPEQSPDSMPLRRQIAIIASERKNPEWLEHFRSGDLTKPALHYLQSVINNRLKGRVSPKLLWRMTRKRPTDLALFFAAESLIGLMWLQFAEVVNGNRQFRQCAACKRWLLISRAAEGSRSSRFTCSTACRMKIYYDRKLEARRLKQGGLTIKQIAQRLNTNTASIKRWIQ